MQLQKLKTSFIGKTIIYYEKIDSTQNEIWRKIHNKTIRNGTVVIANIQTSGKGTHGRVWHTDDGGNVAFSFFIELNCNINILNGITIEIAKIIVDIFNDKYGIKLSIKEPNDIVFKGKKLGGILTETVLKGQIVKYLVVGIGINTNKQIFTKDIKNIATSIKKEFNIEINAQEFIVEFCNRFEEELLRRMGN